MGSQCQEVYVAVGKNQLRNISTLQWTLNNKPADSLVLLHVLHPIRTIPSPFGKIPVKQVCESVVDAQKLNDCMAFYLQICSQAKVKAKALIVMRADVHRGIVEMVSEQGITKLIMGTSSPSDAKSKKLQRPGKAGYVLKHAINSCDISIVCKGKLLFVRERSVVNNEDFGGPLSLHSNFQLDSAAAIKTPENFSDEPGFTPDKGNRSGFDAISELSCDIKVAERQKIDGHETQESPERTDRETLKFLLTEASQMAENARREVQREIVRRKNAKTGEMESPDKFRGIEDASLVSKMKEDYCQELRRRLKEEEAELHAAEVKLAAVGMH
ncbi:hypothetical protein SUGI_0446180 [Cryptomeria japonica]|nr:hypothetical protein SUGI_0446180 [Cryptomeria japonica]